MVDGHVKIKDQICDYVQRGDALESWSYLDFFLDTYDGKASEESTTIRGRPRNVRVPYHDSSVRNGHVHIIRSPGHETMPYFPGQWFPKRSTDSSDEHFEASMLALLKPWRSLLDLKRPEDSFCAVFDTFWTETSDHIRSIITNIEFYHECLDGAAAYRNAADTVGDSSAEREHPNDDSTGIDANENADEPTLFPTLNITEDDIQHAIDNPYSTREMLYADVAIGIGLGSGALNDDSFAVTHPHSPLPAMESQIHQFQVWQKQIDDLQVHDNSVSITDVPETSAIVPLTEMTTHSSNDLLEPSVSLIEQEHPTPSINDHQLNEHQLMAYNIITTHLRSFLNGDTPPQRLMIVHGHGGTGKSTLLNVILNAFHELGASNLLAKTAMSGVAASIIGGQTLHSWASLPCIAPSTNKWITHLNKATLRKRKDNIGGVLWLMIDEMSMLTTTQLTLLCQITGFVRAGLSTIDSTIPFGGLSIVLLGDFHQFPPVANFSKELYNPSPLGEICQLGRKYYTQFDVVILLTEQMRIQDLQWISILECSRTGDCTNDDITEIRKLVLTNPDCDVPDFLKPPWNEVILVTPRNGVCSSWNERALHSHCCRTGHTHYVVYAEDTYQQKKLSPEQRLAIAHLKLDNTGRLPNKVDLAVGMKAMVLENISTDVDLANGSRGVIIDIILDPRENVLTDTSDIVILQHPPAAVLFAPCCNCGTQLTDLPKGTVPIFPSKKKFKLGGKSGCTVERMQIALTPAYAFTDWKSQGQTIENVIIDLAKTPSAALTRFNAYVAMSRSRGKTTIRLLHDFDSKLFTVHPNELLCQEDERLTSMARDTVRKYNDSDFGLFRSVSSL